MRGLGGVLRGLGVLVGAALLVASCGGDEAAETTTSSTVPATIIDPADATTTTSSTTTTTTTEAPEVSASLLMLKVQQELAALGFFDGQVDGVLGPVTAAALEAFQSDAGITADGAWGPETQEALAAALVENEDFVLEIQEKLQALGLYSGPDDGDYGAGTRAAVEELQEQCELEVDGRITALTHVCLDELSEA